MLLRFTAMMVVVGLLFMGLAADLTAHPHITLAEAAARLQEAEQALEEWQQLHGGPPTADHPAAQRWAELQVRRAECYFLLADPQQALSICNMVVAATPDIPDAYSMRRAVYQALGEKERADADALRYLELGAGNPTLAYELARRPVPEDNPEQAQATRALQLALIESARLRWPDDASLLQEQLRLLLILDRERLQPLAKQAYAEGSDGQRVTVAQALLEHGGKEFLADFLRAQDHQWLAVAPADGSSTERIDLAVIFHQAELLDLAQQAASSALVTLQREQQAVQSGEMMAVFFMRGIRGYRARAFAILGRWQEALNIVDSLLAEYHDPLTWLAARVVCLRRLQQLEAAQAAEADFRAFFTDIGMAAPQELPLWP